MMKRALRILVVLLIHPSTCIAKPILSVSDTIINQLMQGNLKYFDKSFQRSTYITDFGSSTYYRNSKTIFNIIYHKNLVKRIETNAKILYYIETGKRIETGKSLAFIRKGFALGHTSVYRFIDGPLNGYILEEYDTFGDGNVGSKFYSDKNAGVLCLNPKSIDLRGSGYTKEEEDNNLGTVDCIMKRYINAVNSTDSKLLTDFCKIKNLLCFNHNSKEYYKNR